MKCKREDCQNELPAGRPNKLYCNNACKQKQYRKTHQEGHLIELETEIMRLRNQLDLERRFLEDNKQRGFKAWLKKQPATPFTKKMLDDALMLPRDTRAHYEYRLRTKGYTDLEIAEFNRLWKTMLIQQP